jgi:hypothetical protein
VNIVSIILIALAIGCCLVFVWALATIVRDELRDRKSSKSVEEARQNWLRAVRNYQNIVHEGRSKRTTQQKPETYH